MSSGAHLSKELHDLIKSIGETRSKQEEDKIILAEQAKLKEKIKEKNQSTKQQRENLIKAMYIEMLGHDASFSHITAVNLTRSSSLQLKRLGYLCCTLFLNEESEFLILLIANFQKDLIGGVHEIVIALTALAKLINPTMINAVYETVQKLLTHQTDLVRKKATIVLQRIYKLNPSLVYDYQEKMRRALCDKEPSVMGSALNLYHQACLDNPVPHKDQAGNFVIILKQVIEHRLPRDFDYHRFPAPWIQIKLLQILSMLGANDIKVSEEIYEILGQALRRGDDTGLNIGHAVTYQCVKTIASIYPNAQLLELASTSVSKFLTSETNNLKFMGINALIKIAQIESKYVVQHQRTIVDCLESKDETLKRETLKLLCKMTNNTNVVTIMDKLIFYLKAASDPHFKKDLVNNICQLSEQFAPDQEWFLKIMNQVFEHGSEHIDNVLLNNFLRLVSEHYASEGEDFGNYLVDSYIETIQKPNLGDIQYKMISWVMGEIGSSLYAQNGEKLNQLVELLMTCITNEFEDSSTRTWILSALAKLSSTQSFEMGEELQACLEYYQSSKVIDIHERSQDFIRLRKYNAALRKSGQVVLDEKLSFLDGFVQEAINNGASQYNEQESIQAAMGISESSKAIYFETRASDKLHTTNHGNDTEVSLVGTGTNKQDLWSKEGFTGKINDGGVSDTVINKPTQGTGFNALQGKNAISSNEFQSTSRPSNPNPYTIGGAPEKPKQENIMEDPKMKQQNQFMSDMFGGVEKNATIAKTSKVTYDSYKKQDVPQKKQSDDVDLLGLSDNNTNQNQNQPPIFGNKPPGGAGGPPIFGSKPPGGPGGPPVFGSKQTPPPVFGQQQQQQKPQQQIVQNNFVLYQIDVEQYEAKWEELQSENCQTLNTQLKTEQQIRNLWQKAQVYVIDVYGNEFICACKNANSQQPILIYTVSNSNGSLEITVKSNNNQEANMVFDFVKNNSI